MHFNSTKVCIRKICHLVQYFKYVLATVWNKISHCKTDHVPTFMTKTFWPEMPSLRDWGVVDWEVCAQYCGALEWYFMRHGWSCLPTDRKNCSFATGNGSFRERLTVTKLLVSGLVHSSTATDAIYFFRNEISDSTFRYSNIFNTTMLAEFARKVSRACTLLVMFMCL